MPFQLRPYQRRATEASIRHFQASGEPACLVLPTGSGKSLIIAELCRLAKGRVMVVAHVKELCAQNHAKFESLAGKAGLFSAGLGETDLSQRVTFASIQSISRHLEELKEPISLLLIDECHRLSGESQSQYEKLLAHLKGLHPTLKVLGLTATPYRMNMGWCYRRHTQKRIVRTEEPRPFESCVFEVTLREMIQDGYLTAPKLEDAPIAQYDFTALDTGGVAPAEQSDVNRLLVQHKRVTRSIIDQVIQLTTEKERQGVMIFAATVDHAREIGSYLPEGKFALILGETPGEERDRLIAAFCAQELRYLVNVAVLTTGFDAPHVDFIAVLRRTESVSLYQQIVGRGLRLSEGKTECLVVDYAGNGYDLFAPEVGENKKESDNVVVEVSCPECGFENEFWGKKDDDGNVLEHYGRRCHALREVPPDHSSTTSERCDYRFRFKECDKCSAENDIAARRCHECETLLVDPDELLKKALRLTDAMVLRVSGMEFSLDQARLKITYHDEDGASVSEKFDLAHRGQRAVFNRIYSRRLASGRSPLELETAEQALQLRALFPCPDFVVARHQKLKGGRAKYWKVQERVFDYEGRFRRADHE